MTILLFDAGNGSAEIVVDGAIEITLAEGSLSGGGALLSRFADGHWHIGEQPLERITCKGVVRVQLRGKSGVQALGPFAEFSLVDGVARAGDAILARYSPLERTWSLGRRDAAATPAPAALPAAQRAPRAPAGASRPAWRRGAGALLTKAIHKVPAALGDLRNGLHRHG